MSLKVKAVPKQDRRRRPIISIIGILVGDGVPTDV
jgi:hypothetical protein